MKAHATVSFVENFLVRVAAARVAILFFFHASVFALCYATATLVRFDFAIPAHYQPIFKSTLPIVVAVQLVVGLFFGFYRGWWRYVGITDVVRLVAGLTTAAGTLGGIWYASTLFGIHTGLEASSRGALLIDFAFALLALFGARLVVRVSRDRLRPAAHALEARRVIIIGAGDAGETLARELEHRPQLGMRVVSFVDDQRAKWGSVIRGIKVTGPISNIAAIADAVGADEALIAIPSASGKRIREIIGHLSEAGLEFKTIPGIDHLVSGKVQVTQLRPVNVEDLLRRKRIDLPGDPVRQMFRGKRVVVTGAGGTIGSELASQIAGFEPESLVLVERSEYALYEVRKRLAREGSDAKVKITNALVDIQQTATVRNLLRSVQPHVVIHAAAHKHVPLGEENPPEYVRNNTLATRTLAELCDEAGVQRFVLISTDKAINPTSVMGATKRAAEILLLDVVRHSSAMAATAVRFGNVIGSSGSVIPLFMEQIAQGGPITVTHPDVTRYFLRTSEAVSLVLQAATLGNRGDVFMLDMGEPVKIVDLARDLIRLSNHTEEEIPIVFSGLRPGEKLFEELRLDGESMQPTVHPQIVVTAAPQPDQARVAQWTAKVRAACERGEDVIPLLRQLIPEYRQPVEPPVPTPTLPIRRHSASDFRPVAETQVATAP
ncbi:MAG TPA: nucleoside-diphosphate sugar epimerase/dehydratase [Thermoanaerobaculia bacterium]|nr:nucleoside-diphosphate sugar epimerase/dehydratase [Thermoanaerobaculia bacterium]